MELLVKKRSPLRTSFTKTYKSLMSMLEDENIKIKDVKIKLAYLERINADLIALDKEILELVLIADDNGKSYSDEYESVEEYKEKFVEALVCANSFFEDKLPSNSNMSNSEKSKLKLPKIELMKFGGEVKDWLSFWSQFKRIHEDKQMEIEDKFQYLIQCMSPNTRAKEIIDSYPPTAENYAKAIESLRARFGREELLVEYYVRELLTLVVKNATKSKLNITQLYDKLESHLRSLESIGMTSDKYSAMLFPLVESCIPEDILRVWLRNPSIVSDNDSSKNVYTEKLKNLLLFLKTEIEGEERIRLTKTEFTSKVYIDRKEKISRSAPLASAIDLFSGGVEKAKNNICIFCDKHHETKDCFSAPKMDLNQKHNLIKEKRGCFICLKVGHRAKKCKTRVCCLICSKNHWAVVCPKLTLNTKNEVKENTEEDKNVILANSCTEDVFLQTLLVNIDANGKKQTVRALFDTGSQRSYILKDTAERIGCKPIGYETLVHSLFGGVTSKKELHKSYNLCISNLDNSYSCSIKLLDQPKICSSLLSLPPGPWMKEIIQKNIHITDTGEKHLPIEILLGADTVGNILTGKLQKLDSGLIAVHTLLGWVIMGKINKSISARNTSTSMITSMLVHNNSLDNLWKLETLGITDPNESKSCPELENAVLDHFHKTLKKDNENRYEVSLPWINDREELPSNRDIAEKRLISLTRKLKHEKKLEDYNAVFEDWLKSGIIEEVLENGTREHVHYLPHRAVFKESSTTAIRPVFDASCKQKNFPSLNDCLAKGPNLLELIPTILLSFREKKIGIISDIRKAFLQVSVTENDRDVLRFLWWKDSEQRQIKEFRHRRVIFGLNCSPFLLEAVINFHLRQYEPPYKCTAEKLRSSFYVDNCVTSVASKEEAELFSANASKMMAEAGFD